MSKSSVPRGSCERWRLYKLFKVFHYCKSGPLYFGECLLRNLEELSYTADLFLREIDKMSLRNGGMKLARRLARQVDVPVAILPAFLCPAILKEGPHLTSYCHHRHLHTTGVGQTKSEGDLLTSRPLASVLEPTLSFKLPVQCPGCGALSQVVEKDDPGYYTLTRRSVKDYFQDRTCTNAENYRERDVLAKAVRALEASENATEDSKEILGNLRSAIAQKTGIV
jgi:hypothetical protein